MLTFINQETGIMFIKMIGYLAWLMRLDSLSEDQCWLCNKMSLLKKEKKSDGEAIFIFNMIKTF